MRLKGFTFENGLYEEAGFSFSFFRTSLFTWVSEGIKIKRWLCESGVHKEKEDSASSGSAHGIALSNTKVPHALETLWHSLVGTAVGGEGRFAHRQSKSLLKMMPGQCLWPSGLE